MQSSKEKNDRKESINLDIEENLTQKRENLRNSLLVNNLYKNPDNLNLQPKEKKNSDNLLEKENKNFIKTPINENNNIKDNNLNYNPNEKHSKKIFCWGFGKYGQIGSIKYQYTTDPLELKTSQIKNSLQDILSENTEDEISQQIKFDELEIENAEIDQNRIKMKK